MDGGKDGVVQGQDPAIDLIPEALPILAEVPLSDRAVVASVVEEDDEEASEEVSVVAGGIDCFADDREALCDFAKYFNNTHLSDITLQVGEDSFPAHRIVLCRSSEVFDRMLSQKWQTQPGGNQGGGGVEKVALIELTEEPQCQLVFHAFLRFLYSNHVALNGTNTLPLLVLADKYNVNGLKRVCLGYAMSYVLPETGLKELFHVWFNYSTKAFHPQLTEMCMEIMAHQFHHIATSPEWEKEWLALDKDQLMEFLRCNKLVVPNEYCVWEAVLKWLKASSHPERRATASSPQLLAELLPLIRFPYMSADELALVESCPVAQHHKVCVSHTHLAYKFISMSLASRAANAREFNSLQFLLRNYSETRWERVVTITSEQLYERSHEHTVTFSTKSNSLSLPQWNWSLGFTILTSQNAGDEQMRATLTAEDIDHTNRSVEWLMMVVAGEKRVVRMVAGSKLFTKSRYSAELELKGRLEAGEVLAESSQILTKGQLRLQLALRPVM